MSTTDDLLASAQRKLESGEPLSSLTSDERGAMFDAYLSGHLTPMMAQAVEDLPEDSCPECGATEDPKGPRECSTCHAAYVDMMESIDQSIGPC
jgi:hypothetical protein